MNTIGWQSTVFTSIFVLMVVGLITLLFSRSTYAKNKAIPFAFANGLGVMGWLAALVYTRYVADIFLAHQLAFSATYILVVGMLGLAITFPNSPMGKRTKRLMAIDMIIGAICIGGILFTDKILTAANFLGSKPAPFSSLGKVYLLILAVHLVLSVVIFVRRYLKEIRNRLYFNYIVLAFILFFLIAAITNIILPLAGVVAFALVGPLTALLPFVTIVYALGITDINDVSYVVAQLIQVGARLALVFLFLIAGALLHSTLKETYYSSSWVITVSVIAGASIVCFHLFGVQLDRFIENRIAYARLSPDEARARLIVALSGEIELERNVAVVLRLIKQAIGVRGAGIILLTKDSTFWSAGDIVLTEDDGSTVLQALVAAVEHRTNPDDLTNIAILPEAVRQLLVGANVRGLKLLRTETGITGLYLLGEKFSQEIFTRQDAALMHAISEIGDLSIERALFYNQIRAFNATLQERIDIATLQLRKANKRLKTLDTMKDDFISMASHQLRSPATSVRDAVQMLGQTYNSPAERKKILELADASSERLVNVVTSMLSVARIQAGHFTIEKTLVDMVELVERTVTQATALAQGKGITIRFDHPSYPVTIKADRAKVIESLSNYLENAIHYSNDHAEVVVTLRQESGRVIFEVRDHGIGVPAGERKQLFDKFFRASNARKNQPNGNGIGLFVVKTVAKAHGGEAYYRPTTDGSIFGFWLKP